MTEFDYDVFISYSSKNKAWVRGELLERIEAAGLKVCIDFRDFAAGRSALLNIQDAIRRSRRSLLVISPDWFTSNWTLFEALLGRHTNPSGREALTIPLLRERCEFPDDAAFIANLTHVDFTDGSDLDLAWRQLLTALGAATAPPAPKERDHPHWHLAHPYPMPPNFTGRVSERGTLTRWLNEDSTHPLLVLRALGGFGKSALTWHWLTHDVDAKQWPRVVWWSFYEGDASFDQFVTEAATYLQSARVGAQPLSPRDALAALLKALHGPGTLLLLDGFERVLRAFSGLDGAYQGDGVQHTDHDRDCVSPLAEDFLRNLATLPHLRSKVLLTTRLTPRIVEAKGGGYLQGCGEVPLLQMQPADAVAFFHAQGIRGTHTEIELACELYGYHPLSLRLLAGLIIGDFQQPGDIAAAKRLDVSGDLVQRQHHVLEHAYDSLAPARRKLLGNIACLRGSVTYDTVKATAESADVLDRDLRDLINRGLLHHEVKERRFDLHPIVRHYAYDRLTAPERTAAHIRLRDYFTAVPAQARVARVEDLAQVIELYHHTVRAGQFDEARALYRDRLSEVLYHQLGAYSLTIDLLRALFPDGESRPPHLKEESHQAWTLNGLANSYSVSGQPRRAVLLFEGVIAIFEKQGTKSQLAAGLGNLAAMAHIPIGALRAAEVSLRRSIALCREVDDEFGEAVGHQDLALLLVCRGADAGFEEAHQQCIALATKMNNHQIQCEIASHAVMRSLLRRDGLRALEEAKKARELADVPFPEIGKLPRPIVRTGWLLGAAHRVAGQYDQAERHLHEALEGCRRINMVDHEAGILIDLARLRAETGAPGDAERLAEEARVIADRSSYVLQGADAHLELAKLAAARGDQPRAREHAQQAGTLATCDGPPDYTYKATYDEAIALLETLK